MKFVITHLENEPHKVWVKNEHTKAFSHRQLKLEPGEKKEVPSDLAKLLFGDWENDSFGEKQRQKSKNIHLLDISHQTKMPQISPLKEVLDQFIKANEKEAEFEDYFQKDEEVEHILEKNGKKICQAISKSTNKQCKKEALEGSDYCGLHQKG